MHAPLQIGNLSARTRVVRVKNVLTAQEDRIEVPSEEAIVEIQERCVGTGCLIVIMCMEIMGGVPSCLHGTGGVEGCMGVNAHHKPTTL